MIDDRRKRSGHVSRRAFLKVGGVAVATAGFPAVLRAQTREVKVGYILPVTGPLAFEAALALNGLTLATDEINAGGGIKSLGAPRSRSSPATPRTRSSWAI